MSPWKITGETNRIWQKQYLRYNSVKVTKNFKPKVRTSSRTHAKTKNKKQGNQEEHRLKT